MPNGHQVKTAQHHAVHAGAGCEYTYSHAATERYSQAATEQGATRGAQGDIGCACAASGASCGRRAAQAHRIADRRGRILRGAATYRCKSWRATNSTTSTVLPPRPQLRKKRRARQVLPNRTCNWSTPRSSTISTARPKIACRCQPLARIADAHTSAGQANDPPTQRLLAAMDLVCGGKHLRRAGNRGAPTRRPVTGAPYRFNCSSSWNGW